MLEFDMVSEIISFEDKGRFGKEKHQNYDEVIKSFSKKVQKQLLEN